MGCLLPCSVIVNFHFVIENLLSYVHWLIGLHCLQGTCYISLISSYISENCSREFVFDLEDALGRVLVPDLLVLLNCEKHALVVVDGFFRSETEVAQISFKGVTTNPGIIHTLMELSLVLCLQS